MTQLPASTTASSDVPTRLRDNAPRRTWEDFQVGDEITTGAVTIGEAHVVGWAGLTGDWVPLHLDEEYASATQFGGRIAHGPLTFAMALGLMTQTHVYDRVLAWLGSDKIRALAPVMLGDTVRARATVSELRESQRPDRAVVTFSFEVRNQRDEIVMTFDNAVLMPRAHGESSEA